MRRHGLPDFPDPTLTSPSSAAGYSGVIDRDGLFFAIPQSINPTSPAYEKAAAACGFGPGGARP